MSNGKYEFGFENKGQQGYLAMKHYENKGQQANQKNFAITCKL